MVTAFFIVPLVETTLVSSISEAIQLSNFDHVILLSPT